MFAACAEMIVTMLLFTKQLWFFIGIALCMIAMFVLLGIDNRDQKEHMDKYVNSYKKKLEILKGVLVTELSINTKEKVEELINIYQEYVDKKKNEEKNVTVSLLLFLQCLQVYYQFPLRILVW